MEALRIHIDGIVQGVGFRPFVARLARSMGLSGWVRNVPAGVDVHVQTAGADKGQTPGAGKSQPPSMDGDPMPMAGKGKTPETDRGPVAEAGKRQAAEAGEGGCRAPLEEFARRLAAETPAAARIVSLETRPAPPEDCDGFAIRPSTHDGMSSTLVSPDLATCDACLAELFDPHDRRFRYPFINCTNCGPRFTIIEQLPYDRPATSMRSFAMCPECAAEYADEADRRYHAQPNACFACGPSLWFASAAHEKADGTRGETGDAGETDRNAAEHAEAESFEIERAGCAHEASDALLERTAAALRDGKVAALKGLGGWHLACDARDETAVRTLRERKRRPSKPLAVMVRDLAAARALCHVDEAEADLLASPARPIVLLARREKGGPASSGKGGGPAPCGKADGETLAPSVAGALPEIGLMLPATPVQHLLLDGLGGMPLVMTSGNRSGEPIVADDAEALDALGSIADVFLGNDRRIVARYDDSVVRVQHGAHSENARDGSSGKDAQHDAENTDGIEGDAVASPSASFVQLVRRARGYAPMPLFVRPLQSETKGAGADEAAAGKGDVADAAAGKGDVAIAGADEREAAPAAAGEDALAATAADGRGGGAPVIFAAGSEQKATFTYLAPAPASAVPCPGGDVGAPDGTPSPTVDATDGANPIDAIGNAPVIGVPGDAVAAAPGRSSAAPSGTPIAPGRAWISQHLGDLEHLGAWRAWEQAKKRYEQLFDLSADALACDLHPEYLASKWARGQAQEAGLPLVEVQHHHAHIAAVMGENALSGRMLGVALDGTGYGPDGTIWGCELLAASRSRYERLWHLPAFFLPGGAAAVLHPERSAFGLLFARSAEPVPDGDPAAWMNSVFTLDNPQWRPFLDALEDRALYEQMAARGLNSPRCSSLGRLLDAVAALLGLAHGHIGYDGEPACLLEAQALRELAAERAGAAATGAAASTPPDADPHEKADLETGGPFTPQTTSCNGANAEEAPGVGGSAGKGTLAQGTPAQGTRARKAPMQEAPLTALALHRLVARTIIEACENARKSTGLARVALGGGCMVNRLLHGLLVGGLEQRGFSVYENVELPPNDACISYGQAIVARARLSEGA